MNKTVSKIATGESKPNGELYVKDGLEKPFLAPLSIKKIPMIGDKTYTLLRNMGIERVRTIQEMPQSVMQQVLGDNGNTIWKKANGIDDTPVVPYRERKSVSSEVTFDKDTNDVEVLKEQLITMIDQLAFDLRKQQQLAATITVKLRYSDFQTHTFQTKVNYTASDHILREKALFLFDKNCNRRVLVRLIGVKLSSLVHGHQQIHLFEDTNEMIALYQAMDKIRSRYGYNALVKGIQAKKDGKT